MMVRYNGLAESEVIKSREEHGSNVIPDSEPTTFWEEFKETFGDPMIKILLVIAGIMIVMFFLGYAEIYEPIGTIVAILIVATVSAKTGVASDTKYRELKDSTEKDKCKVYRNGEVVVIDIDDVVVGDYVLLQSGDKIPADGTLIEGYLKVDNSALNGEAEECKKIAAEDENTMIPDAITGDTFVDKHSLFRGAVVFDGEGVLKIQKVGLKTMMGKMAEEMQEDEPDSPLKVKLAKLAKQISTFGYIGAVVIALFYIAHQIIVMGGFDAYFGQPIQELIMSVIDAVSLAVVIIVCAVPEGLPLMISIVLMQNTSKMLDHNVLVRKAEGIETAGSLNILFSDKTGTITKGRLEVVDMYKGDGKKIPVTVMDSEKKFREFVEIAIGKNTASTYDANSKVVGGNATDQALTRFLTKEAYIKVTQDSTLKVDCQQGFNSMNKFSQVQINGHTYYKGAPEKLIDKATKWINENGDFCEIDKCELNKTIDKLAEKAMRVIALGYSDNTMKEDVINDDIAIIGLLAIRDDVRTEARDAIKEVREAGIQVVMITGDRLETAVAIAKDAGLLDGDRIALSSAKLNEMTDDEVKKIVPKIAVIARALPTDKSRMVRLCQEMGLVVGMTGDGVNDSPALKKADVGFAMGSGTEAAKEAGKIVILDDNFQSIKDAILYGRTIYHNILKFCKFQLAINVTAVVVSAISPFLGIEEPLKVTHLLFVNLVMDSLGALMLGNEPAMASYMKEKPRKRDESIISKSMATSIGLSTAIMLFVSFGYLTNEFVNWMAGSDEAHITGYFVLFISLALFNGFNVRTDSKKWPFVDGIEQNPNFLKILLLIMAVQAFIVFACYIPGLEFISNMFSCVAIEVQFYVMSVLLGAIVLGTSVIEIVIGKRK